MKITKSYLKQLIREAIEDPSIEDPSIAGSRMSGEEIYRDEENEKPKHGHIDWEYLDTLVKELDYVNALEVLNAYLSSKVKDPKQRQKEALKILIDRIQNFDVPY